MTYEQLNEWVKRLAPEVHNSIILDSAEEPKQYNYCYIEAYGQHVEYRTTMYTVYVDEAGNTVKRCDFIRKKGLTQDTYGLVWSINYKDDSWDIIGGLNIQNFSGNHYGYAGGTLSAYLPKDWTMTFDGNWSSPMTTGYNTSGSTYFLSFGVRKKYMKKGLIFNLNVQDLARSLSFRNDDKGLAEGYRSWHKNTVRQQRVTLSLTWMFGQFQKYKNRKVGNMDELNRLGGGGVSTGK